MRFSRRVTASVLAPLMLATAVTGCNARTGQDAASTVIVAADLELSGAGAVSGAAYERALQLRIEQLNTAGSLGNRTLTLRVLDNRSDPTVSLRNISTFAADPDVAALVTGSCSECVVGAAKTINDTQLPTISLAPATQVGSPAGQRRHVFKLAPDAADSAAVLVAQLRRTGAEQVGILYADDMYGRDGHDAMKAELAKAGMKVTAAARVKPTAQNVDQAISTLTRSKPDALVVWTASDQATLAAISARRAAFTGRIYFDAAAAGELFLSRAATQATTNATMVFTQILAIDDVIATSPAKAARKQWFRDYTSRYGSYSGVAAFAADAADLIAAAVAKVGGDRDQIRQVLETSQTDALSGPIRFTPDDHSGLTPQALTLLAARSGRWRLLA